MDLENVIEEIETLGRSERSALRSTIANILEHMIKLNHGMDRDPARGWHVTVTTQRQHAERTLKDSPSLRRELPNLIDDEYPRARRTAMASFEAYEPERLADYERAIPKTCPYSVEDVLG